MVGASSSVRTAAHSVLGKIKTMMLTVAFIGLLIGATAFGAFADNLGDVFLSVKLGLTEPATIALMSRPPDSLSSTRMVGGVIFETLKWTSGGRTFVVRLIGAHGLEPRVVSTKTCAGFGAC